MGLSFQEILAAKRVLVSTVDDNNNNNEDLFSLTSSTSVTSEASLRVFLTLVYIGHSKANLTANDCENLEILAAWLSPFNSYHLPYNDKIPKLLQSFTLWQVGRITGIPPAKLWGEILSIIVEEKKKSLDFEKSL